MVKYDLVVLGGGSAGLVCAVGAAKLGASVCLIEKDRLGGDCLWSGCVPSKALIRSAKVAWDVRTANQYGLEPSKLDVDLSKVMKRVAGVQSVIGEHDDPRRFEALGIRVMFGNPSFLSTNKISVKDKDGCDEWITAKKVVIATGTHPMIPDIPGLKEAGFVDNTTIFSLKKLPKHLVVLGAGPIGIEMAQAFYRLGSQVTILSRSEGILSREDQEMARQAQYLLEREGIRILTKTDVVSVAKDRAKKVLTIQTKGKRSIISCDELLVATGRSPNIDGLHLEVAGVRYDTRGIITNDRLQTTSKSIYAAGDITGKFLFTHMAEYQARLVIRNALFPFSSAVSYKAVPWATFIDPELARVGVAEEDLKKSQTPYLAFRFEFKDVDRAQTENSSDGLVKLLTDKKGRILGAHILGPNAGELIHEFVLAMQHDLPISKISSTIHIYPTLAQGVRKAADQFLSQKLFTPRIKSITRLLIKWFA